MRVAFLKQQSTNGWEYIPIEYCVAGKEKLERSAPLASQLHFLSEQYLFLLFCNLVENMYSGQDYYDDIVEALLRKCGFEKIDYDEAEKFKQSLTSKDIELLKPSGKPPVLHTYNGSYEGSKINQPVMAGDIINLLSYYRWLLANRNSLSLVENSRMVQTQGVEIFMEQQKEKFTCPECGGIISIHDAECSECQWKIQKKREE